MGAVTVIDDAKLKGWEKGYVQYYNNELRSFSKLNAEAPVAGSVFMFLSTFMNEDNAVICSQEYLANYFNKSRMTIYRALKYLEDNKYLEVHRTGGSNIYSLSAKIVWKDATDKRKVPTMQVTAILDGAEEQK